jgi:hypothetical protein
MIRLAIFCIAAQKRKELCPKRKKRQKAERGSKREQNRLKENDIFFKI